MNKLLCDTSTGDIAILVVFAVALIVILVVYEYYPRWHIRLYGLIFQPNFYDIEYFSDMKQLQDNFEAIREETKSIPWNINDIYRPKGVWATNNDIGPQTKGFVANNIEIEGWMYAWQTESGTKNNNWLNYPLMFQGTEFKNNLKHCPILHSILLQHRDKINVAGLSLMRPNSQINPHRDTTGPRYGSLGYHLGLIVPDPIKCTLTVNDKIIHQREGHSIVFDPTQLHSAANKSNTDRIILYIDFKI